PSMPSGWVWLVILLLAFFMLYIVQDLTTGSTIDYSDFRKLVNEKKVVKVTFVGKERLEGEVKDPADEAVRALKIRSGKFSVTLPPIEDRGKLQDVLDNAGVKPSAVDDKSGWVGPVLLILMPAVLLLAVFFLFLLP